MMTVCVYCLSFTLDLWRLMLMTLCMFCLYYYILANIHIIVSEQEETPGLDIFGGGVILTFAKY